jgi:hypothetical protein
VGSHLLEANGGILPENGRPLSLPYLFNLTLVGSGTDNSRTGICFSRNAAGWFSNSILLNQQDGVRIEFKPGVEDSYEQFKDGNLQLMGNVFYDVSGNDADSAFMGYSADPGEDLTVQNASLRLHFSDAGNKIEDPGMSYGGGQYRLVASDYIFSGLAPYPDEWFDEVSYQGAFGTFNWASGWTLLSQEGILLD